MRISDLKRIIDKDYSNELKPLGVLLVDNGFMKYSKMNVENFNYWWYEMEDKTKINKKNYTYDLNDLLPTKKLDLVKELICYHNDKENVYTILNNALQIIDCGTERCIDRKEYMKDIVFNMLYGSIITQQHKRLF